VTDPAVWKLIRRQQLVLSLKELDKRRSGLIPVFDPEDSTTLQISKGERGEQLIESFRTKLLELIDATTVRNATKTLLLQKEATLVLSEVGELLVPMYPYEVPVDGKFSFLPRLLGQARATFTFRRHNEILGNVTIVADGYVAPITAGDFVDLNLRNFSTGLPVKITWKKAGSGSRFEVATIPILGSFKEGFNDPLTAKSRRIPFETIRLEADALKLSYG